MPRRFQVIRGGQDAKDKPPKLRSQAIPIPFEEALVAYLDNLFGLAMRLVGGHREPAEDLVQEACLRALRNYEHLRSPEKIKSWLFQILVNIHLNEFHQRHKLPIVDVELTDALLDIAAVATARTPEDQVFEQLLNSEVQQALDALPMEFRTVVWLADVEELNYKEIAVIIQCPPGTVASRRYRGHSLLRENLRAYARQRGLLKE